MPIAIAFFFVLAAIVVFAATMTGVLFWYQFPARSTELMKYQPLFPLFTALTALFAASLASLGVGLTIINQRQIASKQLAAERQEQDRARALTKQQIASAFIGEIEVILDELRHDFLKPVLKRALNDLSKLSGQPSGGVQVDTARIGRLGRYYESGPGNVGLFVSNVSRGLTRFYATIEEVRLDLDWYSNAIDLHTNEGKRIMRYSQITSLLKKILSDIDRCLEAGPKLIDDLKRIRDAKLQ